MRPSPTPALPASHPASAPGAQLAAWTVARQADGSIQVTIRELRDPGGLQQRLRADGVPASVTFSGQQNPACQGYPGGGSQSQRRQLLGSVVTAPAAGRDVMVIHPAALPSGAGLRSTPSSGTTRGSVAVSRGSPWAWCRPARSAPAASYPARDLAWPVAITSRSPLGRRGAGRRWTRTRSG